MADGDDLIDYEEQTEDKGAEGAAKGEAKEIKKVRGAPFTRGGGCASRDRPGPGHFPWPRGRPPP